MNANDTTAMSIGGGYVPPSDANDPTAMSIGGGNSAYPPPMPDKSVQPGVYAAPSYPSQAQVADQQQQFAFPTTTVVVAGSSRSVSMFGELPVRCTCPNCQATIVTKTSSEPGMLAWLGVGGLCFVGCWLGCCLIPLCVPSCLDVVHRCPNCLAVVGKLQRLEN